MLTLCSFLQSMYQFAKTCAVQAVQMTRRMYRISAVIMSGGIVIAVLTFTSAGFAGGHNALTVHAETPPAETEEEKETEEMELLTEAKLQLHLTDSDSLKNGQVLLGNALARDIQEEMMVRQEKQAAAEDAKEKIRQIEEEKRKAAEEAAARQAEEERLRREEETRRASAVVSYSDRDYEVLKQIVEAEAGICDIKGRILVANVVLNRVRDGEFPDNITDVVYQRSQFSPVSDGRINTCKVTAETVEAVNRALAGEDYSDGALYFMNRRRSGSGNVRWFDGRLTYLFQHDRHEFFK